MSLFFKINLTISISGGGRQLPLPPNLELGETTTSRPLHAIVRHAHFVSFFVVPSGMFDYVRSLRCS